MTRWTRAALLSGLVFPGLGHLALKQYRRGGFVIVLAAVAMSMAVNVTLNRALAVIDRIGSGQIAADAGEVSRMIADASAGAGQTLLNIAMLVFAGCWVFGIVDSCRLGRNGDA